jgi:hypothetical protein
MTRRRFTAVVISYKLMIESSELQMKPERWSDPNKNLFPHQVDFTAPPGESGS